MSEVEGQGLLHLSVTETRPLLPIRTGWALPDYSGDKACIKCGEEKPTTRFHDYVDDAHPCFDIWAEGHLKNSSTFPEHHDRRCVNCGYEWVEAVI